MHGILCVCYIRMYVCTMARARGIGGLLRNGEPVMANITPQSNAITEQCLRHLNHKRPLSGKSVSKDHSS